MSYSNYVLRRQILADAEMTPVEKISALVVVDHTDWATGQKKFSGRKHMENWLKGLAEQYGINPDQGTAVEWMRFVIREMCVFGYATLDTKEGLFSLHQQSEWSDEDETDDQPEG